MLRLVLDEVGSLVSTSWASWDEERVGVVYHTSVPLREGARSPEVNIEAFFPVVGTGRRSKILSFRRLFVSSVPSPPSFMTPK